MCAWQSAWLRGLLCKTQATPSVSKRRPKRPLRSVEETLQEEREDFEGEDLKTNRERLLAAVTGAPTAYLPRSSLAWARFPLAGGENELKKIAPLTDHAALPTAIQCASSRRPQPGRSQQRGVDRHRRRAPHRRSTLVRQRIKGCDEAERALNFVHHQVNCLMRRCPDQLVIKYDQDNSRQTGQKQARRNQIDDDIDFEMPTHFIPANCLLDVRHGCSNPVSLRGK